MTLDEMNELVLNSVTPSHGDGISNIERTAYICAVFDCDTINLNASMPYADLLKATDVDVVRAAYHLAKLQYQFVLGCGQSNLIDPAEADITTAYLHVTIMKLGWHLKHLEMDRPTPPLPFIH